MPMVTSNEWEPKLMKTLLTFSLAFLLAWSVAGCGGGGGGDSTAPPQKSNTWDRMSWDQGQWQ